jgi:hypothetical protein
MNGTPDRCAMGSTTSINVMGGEVIGEYPHLMKLPI